MLQKFSIQQLKDLVTVLEFIEDDEYNKPMDVVYGSTIGKHTRHVIEYYQVFNKDHEKTILNYDKRKRCEDLETDRIMAIKAIKKLKKKLVNVPNEKDLVLKVKISNQSYFMPTTVAREFLYLLEHTTHHLAYIRLGLSNLRPDAKDLPKIGVAYSTPTK